MDVCGCVDVWMCGPIKESSRKGYVDLIRYETRFPADKLHVVYVCVISDEKGWC